MKIITPFAAACLSLCLALLSHPAHSRIDRLEILRVTPAFDGQSFGETGKFEHVVARAYGSLDPRDQANSSIQDIALAPRNGAGRVEYVTDVEILRPAQPEKSNGVLLFNITNRGNKGALALFNTDVPANLTQINALRNAGDGFLQKTGTTLIWFGWQGDVSAGNGRMQLELPVARHPDGRDVTGIIRSELIARTTTPTLHLVAGWFSATSRPYAAATIDNRSADTRDFARHYR